jgi:F-box protein, helicase, 18
LIFAPVMKLTQEQELILSTNHNIKINAIAGSGKTTTIIQYAKTRPSYSKILYIAFNKSVKQEAELKFAKEGLNHVKIETAHSLAFKNIVYGSNYKIANEYQSYELAKLLEIKLQIHPNEMYILCNHIIKFAAYFCNSNALKISELNYLDVVDDPQVNAFVKHYYIEIEKFTRIFLAKMHRAEIDITHDFYLKLFQLKNPILPFNYILFDEGQDASPAMLSVFANQTNAIKVIVGDTHQQIYSWRFAINSLNQVDYENFYLSNSFRFNADTATLAREILEWKSIYSDFKKTEINGLGEFKELKTKATLARTNLGLLKKAIDYMSLHNNKKKIYFEGNFNSYTYADEGASLYDILNLYNGNRARINNGLIKSMSNIAQLQEYIDKTEDRQLGMMLELVLDYENEIFDIIKNIKEKHTANKYDADMVFSTIHKCKGMEYDIVELAEDFITQEKVEKLKEETKKDKGLIKKLDEEINLLYVAVTRAKKQLHIPESLLPFGFETENDIFTIEKVVQEELVKNKYTSTTKNKSFQDRVSESVGYHSKNKFTKPEKIIVGKRGMPWTLELDQELKTLNDDGWSILKLAMHFNRSQGAITARLRKFEMEDF